MGAKVKNLDKFEFSMGRDKYDNRPKQIVTPTFDDFKIHVLDHKSTIKGKTYFCGGFDLGQHKDPKKYPEIAAYRLKKLAKQRGFIAFDFDGFSTPEKFRIVMDLLNKYRGFGYTTWSHSSISPRARAILELNKCVTEQESQAICWVIEREINKHVGFGNVIFDKSVYMLEQPIYSPPTKAEIFNFTGEIVNAEVFALMGSASLEAKNPKILRKINCLSKKSPPFESPREIAKLKSMLNFIDADCDYLAYRQVVWAILSTNWQSAEDIALNWSLTAPDRFNQTVFDDLINNFDIDHPDCPSLGSINFLAKEGGWNE